MRIESAKRRLFASLIARGLPVASKVNEDPQRGLAFDLLHALAGGPAVVTGHDDGVITLDVEEADDATREQRRSHLMEPYRTLLGHLRHESGHYYWQRLVDGGPWHAPFRQLFGDERTDYAAALQRHYANGPAANWGTFAVTAYASSHPWEDWAETWAHYLHMVDTLATAHGFALDTSQAELRCPPYTAQDFQQAPAAFTNGDAGPQDAANVGHNDNSDNSNNTTNNSDRDAADFALLATQWTALTGVLNELSRSMGVADFYPFVWSLPAVQKMYFVHRVMQSASGVLRA